MKCKICGYGFKLKKEQKYLVTKPMPKFIVTKDTTVYEAFDCPKCGCQIIVGERLPVLKTKIEEVDDGLLVGRDQEDNVPGSDGTVQAERDISAV